MLIINRCPGQSIIVALGGQEIEIIVSSVIGNQVKLGFFDPNIDVFRKELTNEQREGIRKKRIERTTNAALDTKGD